MSALVQQAAGVGVSSVVVALPSSTTAGDTLIGSFCLPDGIEISSVADSQGNRWIQSSRAFSDGGNCEIWQARGISGGTASVTAIVSIVSTDTYDSGSPYDEIYSYDGGEGSVGANVSEWSGLWWVSPLDAWSQQFGTGSSVSPQTVSPRTTGGIVIAVGSSSASVGGPLGGFTALSMSGGTGYAAAYQVLSGSVASSMHWPTSASAAWSTAEACFLPGQAGVNPRLQFPETLVQIATNPNWQAPIVGQGVWTDITSYTQSMTIGPIGRQHELDRIQAAPSQITLDNRSGVFNPWNTTSFLFNAGHGLKPMNPVKVTSAWNGVTYPNYYGYLQSITNQIKDVLNVDAQMNCIDIFQILSLKYLANNNYAETVVADGGANLVAYYRLGDFIGSFTVADSSGNHNTGSLVSGVGGDPAYGAAGAFLYDPSTALDLTNGTNLPNGGFQMVDNTTEPPTVHDPLSSASVWTFECWAKWTQTTTPAASVAANGSSSSVAAVPNGILLHGQGVFQNISGSAQAFEIQAGMNSDPNNPQTITNTIYVAVSSTHVRLQPSFQLSTNIFDGNFHHIVITTTRIGSFSEGAVFVDGQREGGAQSVVEWPILPTSIVVGSPPQGVPGLTNGGTQVPAVPWSGVIADVAVYRASLPAYQIANHYSVGRWFQSQETAVGSGPTPRLATVISVTGLPSVILYCPYNFLTVLYGETNPVTTTSALNYVQTMSETEPGLIFQSPTGMIYAFNRQYQYKNPTSTTSQGIFGDNTSTAQYHYEGASFTTGQDDLDVFNDIQVQSGRGGFQLSATNALAGSAQDIIGAPFTVGGGQLQEWGPGQSSAMATSASIYGSRTLQGLTSLQFEYDSDALAVAQNYAVWYRSPIFRVQQMALNSFANGGANMSQMLGRAIYDRVTVQYQGQVPGPQFSQDALIEQISHNVTMQDGPIWTTTWALSPYEILMNATYLGEYMFG